MSSLSELRDAFGIKKKEQPQVHNDTPKPSNTSAKNKGFPEFLRENADYVSMAENILLVDCGHPSHKEGKRNYGHLTTSKIYNILSLVNTVHSKAAISQDELPQDIVNDIRYMKLRMVYEAGRGNDVLNFCNKAGIIDAISFIGNSKKLFLRYAKYVEALVAYHKFYSDSDK